MVRAHHRPGTGALRLHKFENYITTQGGEFHHMMQCPFFKDDGKMTHRNINCLMFSGVFNECNPVWLRSLPFFLGKILEIFSNFLDVSCHFIHFLIKVTPHSFHISVDFRHSSANLFITFPLSLPPPPLSLLCACMCVRVLCVSSADRNNTTCTACVPLYIFCRHCF